MGSEHAGVDIAAAHAALSALLGCQLPDPMSVKGLGFEGLAVEALALLFSSRTARLRGRIAHEKGLPYSEVRERWSDEDLAMSMAFVAWEAGEKAKRCPECGVDPAEVQDPDTHRILDHGAWRISVEDCWFCAQLRRAEDAVTPELRKEGFRVRTLPRDWDDEFLTLPGDGSE